jgi:hypothetical protein
MLQRRSLTEGVTEDRASLNTNRHSHIEQLTRMLPFRLRSAMLRTPHGAVVGLPSPYRSFCFARLSWA